MADDPFCDFGQLPRSMCGHCRRDRSVVTAVQPDFARLADMASEADEGVGPLVPAYYDSRCRGCGGDILAGDFIAYSEAEGKYVCADCAQG